MTEKRRTRTIAISAIALGALGVAALLAVTVLAPTALRTQEELLAPFYVADKERDQPAPSWCDIDGDVLVLRIDETQIASAVVNNYPRFGPEGQRIPHTLDEVTALLPLVEGRTFSAAQSLASWNKEQEGWMGGYSTSVEFFDRNGDCVGCVSYNGAFLGDGVAVLAAGTIYQMDGDQQGVIEFLDQLVESLYDEGMAS